MTVFAQRHFPRTLLANYVCLCSKTWYILFGPVFHLDAMFPQFCIQNKSGLKLVSIRKPLSSPNWKHLMMVDESSFNWQLLDVVWSNVRKPDPNLISVHQKIIIWATGDWFIDDLSLNFISENNHADCYSLFSWQEIFYCWE